MSGSFRIITSLIIFSKNECLCSEEDLEKYICDPDEEGPGEKTQHTLCAGWCQLKGKQSGKLYFQHGVIKSIG